MLKPLGRECSKNSEKDMESISQVLTSLEDLAGEIRKLPEDDRVLFYRKIYPLILTLKGALRTSPNSHLEQKIDELEWHLTIIAKLHEADDASEDEHYQGALSVIGDLKGPEGFGRFAS